MELFYKDLYAASFKYSVSSRCLSLQPAAKLFDLRWLAIVEYFLTILPDLANGSN